MKWMAGTLAALVVGAAASAAGEATPPAAGNTAQQTDTTAPRDTAAPRDAAEAAVPVTKEAMVKDAEAAVSNIEQTDPSIKKLVSSAAGYAVFPSVGKGAVGVGGAYGKGVLFEHGRPIGSTSLTQVTVGAQLGGQAYSEIVFLEDAKAISNFKKGQLAMAAQVSAVAVHEGASANAKYAHGVAVVTLAKGGLMAEASVGGQRFAFKPFGT
jgi:lipid-binding SYLF domain-containing protein